MSPHTERLLALVMLIGFAVALGAFMADVGVENVAWFGGIAVGLATPVYATWRGR